MNIPNHRYLHVFLAWAAIFICAEIRAQTNCMSPPAGLVSWWRAENNALDHMGANNGLLSGNTSYGTGRTGQGFVFDGASDAVIVGNAPGLQVQDLTIEAWVKRASTTVVTVTGIFGNGQIFGFGQNGYGLYLSPSGQPALSKIDVDNVTSSQSITD